MSKFKYFPSFSVAGFGQALRKDLKLKNGLTSRFYSKEFPQKYRHIEFLISAGHFLMAFPNSYQKVERSKKCGRIFKAAPRLQYSLKMNQFYLHKIPQLVQQTDLHLAL